jgi:5-methyltetrahydrofolate--homocysteine methyltransferase
MASDPLSDLASCVIAGDGDTAKAITARLLDEGVTGREIMDDGLLPGMDTVGARMKAGQTFIPEVLLSARTMQECLELVKPHLTAAESAQRGTIVIGTVEGDVHDIGKNLVSMMLEGAGFSVVNVGTGVTPAQFVAAVTEHDAGILAMSGLLTTTIPKMSDTIALLKEAGLRDSVRVLVGGAPVTESFADEIGADAYGANAAAAVERAKQLTGTISAS